MLPVSNLLDGNLLVGKLPVSKLLAHNLWGLGWRTGQGPGADAPTAGP
jgi:hypothetical protein